MESPCTNQRSCLHVWRKSLTEIVGVKNVSANIRTTLRKKRFVPNANELIVMFAAG